MYFLSIEMEMSRRRSKQNLRAYNARDRDAEEQQKEIVNHFLVTI